MNKLTHLESQRIMYLLDETLLKIHLTALVTRDQSSVPSDIWEIFSEDLLTTIKQHKLLEEQYSEFLASSRRADQQEVTYLLHLIWQEGEYQEKFKSSTLTLCRLLSVKIINTLTAEASERFIRSNETIPCGSVCQNPTTKSLPKTPSRFKGSKFFQTIHHSRRGEVKGGFPVGHPIKRAKGKTMVGLLSPWCI